jgi:hypothetical protein
MVRLSTKNLLSQSHLSKVQLAVYEAWQPAPRRFEKMWTAKEGGAVNDRCPHPN